jgi:hypothetical protein
VFIVKSMLFLTTILNLNKCLIWSNILNNSEIRS